MKPTPFKPATLTAAGALTAAIAALTLTACGPNDSAETAQLAAVSGGATPQAQVTPLPGISPPQLVERQGSPVPSANTAPVPVYASPSTQRVATAAQAGYAPPPASIAQSRQTDDALAREDALPAPAPMPRAVERSRVGSISSIEPIRERSESTGAGAVIGGVLGAVVGNQFGHGSGRAVMTGAGAIGGAVAGNSIERNRRTAVTGYTVAVRLDSGAIRTFQRTQLGSLQVGDRVQLDSQSFHRV